MPAMTMVHDVDPAKLLLDQIGSLDGIDIYNNQVLVAIYQRPEKTVGGIILTEQYRGEDVYQSKVGLIVKLGPDAFHDPKGEWFNDVDLSVGDWAIFRPSDGWHITVNKVLCRILDDTVIRGKTDHPDRIW